MKKKKITLPQPLGKASTVRTEPKHEKYQMLPELSGEQFEALKQDIAERGVLVPVILPPALRQRAGGVPLEVFRKAVLRETRLRPEHGTRAAERQHPLVGTQTVATRC